MSLFSKESKNGKDYIKQKYGLDVNAVEQPSSVERLYSVYDKVCGEYNPPFVCRNMPTAIRNMRDSLKDAKQSIIAMHPEDYVLVEVGTFDKESGVVLPINRDFCSSYELSQLFVSVKEEIKENDEVPNK